MLKNPFHATGLFLYPLKRRLLAKVDMEVRCSQEPGYPLEGIVITHKISIFFFPTKSNHVN